MHFHFLAKFTKCFRQVYKMKVLKKDHEDLCLTSINTYELAVQCQYLFLVKYLSHKIMTLFKSHSPPLVKSAIYFFCQSKKKYWPVLVYYKPQYFVKIQKNAGGRRPKHLEAVPLTIFDMLCIKFFHLFPVSDLVPFWGFGTAPGCCIRAARLLINYLIQPLYPSLDVLIDLCFRAVYLLINCSTRP